MSHVQILLIDDDEDFRETVEETLQELGYSVATASDGRQGLAWLKTSAADLVLCDLLMPQMDGLEVVDALAEQTPRPRLVLMSGGGSVGADTYLELGAQLGTDATLRKPFSRQQLSDVIAPLLAAV